MESRRDERSRELAQDGRGGFLGANAPAEYGGGGVDFIYDAIVMEELSRVRAHGLMMSLHSDICMPYITSFGNEEQKRRYLPGAISGETILAIAMTEPGTGSDLAAVQTTARRDGDHYVINGSKIFISNGQIADLVIVVCKTDPKANPPHKGVSLMLVDATAPGLRSRAQARQAWAARPGHQRIVLRGLPRPGRQPARQGRRGLQNADGETPAGAALHRSHFDGELPAHARGHHRILQESAKHSGSRSRNFKIPSSNSPR